MLADETASLGFARSDRWRRYLGWSEADAERIRQVGGLLQSGFAELIADFCTAIQEDPEDPEAVRATTAGVARTEQTERLKGVLGSWLEELFCGVYDEAYVTRRRQAGWWHQDIPLDPAYSIVAVSRLGYQLQAMLRRRWSGSEQELCAASALLQLLLELDLAVIQNVREDECGRRVERAERFAALGQISASIAHELRNPLNVIRTSAYYLIHAQHADARKAAEHLRRIERQVLVADGVITALTRFTRLPSPVLGPVPLEACLREVVEEIELPGDIAATVQVEPRELAVAGDREQLRIVFSNLVRNAREALTGGGRIQISAGEEAEHVWVSVADNGCGISPDDLPRIARPLFTTKARGLGLGLAISTAIVEKHGAGWQVDSELGRGTTFTLRFRRAGGPPGDTPRPPPT